jgi:hypothetical protein
MADIKLETDNSGNVITKPVTAWALRPVAEMAVLLVMRYINSPEEFETGGDQVQFVMTPQQCLELAEVLTRQAKAVLQTPPSSKTRH